MMNCTKDEVKNEMSKLLESAFEKQKNKKFQSSDVEYMMEASKTLLKEDKVEEVMQIMSQFKSQFKYKVISYEEIIFFY